MASPRAFPLQWPDGWPRTPEAKQRRSAFRTTEAGALRNLQDELTRLNAASPVISSNIPLRRDGQPYASYGRISDPGVAVYWKQRVKDEWVERVIWPATAGRTSTRTCRPWP